jgi:hypothetical protein
MFKSENCLVTFEIGLDFTSILNLSLSLNLNLVYLIFGGWPEHPGRFPR